MYTYICIYIYIHVYIYIYIWAMGQGPRAKGHGLQGPRPRATAKGHGQGPWAGPWASAHGPRPMRQEAADLLRASSVLDYWGLAIHSTNPLNLLFPIIHSTTPSLPPNPPIPSTTFPILSSTSQHPGQQIPGQQPRPRCKLDSRTHSRSLKSVSILASSPSQGASLIVGPTAGLLSLLAFWPADPKPAAQAKVQA